MRSSAPVSSGMPTGKKYMGWWGDLGGPKQKYITSYTVSQFRQNPMRGAFQTWASQGVRRVLQQAPYFVLPLGIGYAAIQWAVADNDIRNSKVGHLQGKFP